MATPSILPPAGEPWSLSLLALSRAERDHYGPEFRDPSHRPPPLFRDPVGVTD